MGQRNGTDYSMETLEYLVQNPKEGRPLKFAYKLSDLQETKKAKVDPACYIVASGHASLEDFLKARRKA